MINVQVPKVKVENDKLSIEGDFRFEFSPTMITGDSVPVKEIKFLWSPEISQSIQQQFGETVIVEMFAEKLKQDFMKLSQQKLSS